MSLEKIGPVYCINLRNRKDRLKEVSRIFDKLKVNVNYHIVDKHPEGGTHGCFNSHIEIITDAYKKGYERCVIFEDDIVLTEGYNKKQLRKCIRFMNKNKTWNIFYLGVLPDIRKSQTQIVENNIYKLSGICTHAYVIHKRLMEKLIGLKYIGIPIDYLYMQLNECYAVYPTMFFQGLSPSDIASTSWNTSLRSDVVVRAYYRFQEMYAYYVKTPLLSFKMWMLMVLSFGIYAYTKKIEYALAGFVISLLII